MTTPIDKFSVPSVPSKSMGVILLCRETRWSLIVEYVIMRASEKVSEIVWRMKLPVIGLATNIVVVIL